MKSLDYVDLEIMFQAKKSKNGINPETLDKQKLFHLGVWEIVDRLASLEEKKILIKNQKGLFELTKEGANIFWNKEFPLWLNLLKLLQVKPLTVNECTRYLAEPMPAVQQALDVVRKKEYVLMSPLREGEKFLKMYEILPKGVKQLTKPKKADVSVVKQGDKLILELEDGEGILYEIVDDLVNPLRMIKTLSKKEIHNYE